jgi:hypothetical protein
MDKNRWWSIMFTINIQYGEIDLLHLKIDIYFLKNGSIVEYLLSMIL